MLSMLDWVKFILGLPGKVYTTLHRIRKIKWRVEISESSKKSIYEEYKKTDREIREKAREEGIKKVEDLKPLTEKGMRRALVFFFIDFYDELKKIGAKEITVRIVPMPAHKYMRIAEKKREGMVVDFSTAAVPILNFSGLTVKMLLNEHFTKELWEKYPSTRIRFKKLKQPELPDVRIIRGKAPIFIRPDDYSDLKREQPVYRDTDEIMLGPNVKTTKRKFYGTLLIDRTGEADKKALAFEKKSQHLDKEIAQALLWLYKYKYRKSLRRAEIAERNPLLARNKQRSDALQGIKFGALLGLGDLRGAREIVEDYFKLAGKTRDYHAFKFRLLVAEGNYREADREYAELSRIEKPGDELESLHMLYCFLRDRTVPKYDSREMNLKNMLRIYTFVVIKGKVHHNANLALDVIQKAIKEDSYNQTKKIFNELCRVYNLKL